MAAAVCDVVRTSAAASLVVAGALFLVCGRRLIATGAIFAASFAALAGTAIIGEFGRRETRRLAWHHPFVVPVCLGRVW